MRRENSVGPALGCNLGIAAISRQELLHGRQCRLGRIQLAAIGLEITKSLGDIRNNGRRNWRQGFAESPGQLALLQTPRQLRTPELNEEIHQAGIAVFVEME